MLRSSFGYLHSHILGEVIPSQVAGMGLKGLKPTGTPILLDVDANFRVSEIVTQDCGPARLTSGHRLGLQKQMCSF